MTSPAFVLRPSTPDSALPASSSDGSFQPPSPEQLLGLWFITHTSLPFWRDKRNIKITYAAPSSSSPLRLNADPITDAVTYQPPGSATLKTVQGVNTRAQGGRDGAWDWRGSGWVKVVSNHWEILGYGGGEEGGCWMVIFTHKSFFAPAAVHVYSRGKEALGEETRKALMGALARRRDLKDLVGSVFLVQQD